LLLIGFIERDLHPGTFTKGHDYHAGSMIGYFRPKIKLYTNETLILKDLRYEAQKQKDMNMEKSRLVL